MKHFITKRTLIASLLGLTAFGAVFGSAASLGTLNADDIGATSDVIASCDTDGVSIAYTKVYDAAGTPGYKVTEAVVSGINAGCAGKTIHVALTDSTDGALGEGQAAVAGTTVTVALTPKAPALDVVKAHVVIS